MRTSSTAVVLALSFAVVACGGAPPAQTAQREPSAATTAPTTTAAAIPEKVTSLRRSALKQTIARGLGYVLQDIMVEDYPVMHGDKFHGFKIQTISAAWGGVDLRPGDVVTRVNGLPIEHPEEADAALRSLEKARALRVDYERDGKPRTLELPITED
jgi:type II secretory pathway component PulC